MNKQSVFLLACLHSISVLGAEFPGPSFLAPISFELAFPESEEPAVEPDETSNNDGMSSGARTSEELLFSELEVQLDEQADEIAALKEQIKDISIFGPIDAGKKRDPCAPITHRVPLVMEETVPPNCSGDPGDASKFSTQFFHVDYDNAFVIRPFDKDKYPFEIQVKSWIQFRHHAFARDVTSWIDNAGVVRPVRNRNAFDMERARLTFAGYAIDPRFTYFLQLDGDTDGRHGVDFFDYLWQWRFSDVLSIAVGKRKVPASRQWLLGARRTRFVDRPMVNDFFRPDRTVGIFAIGKIGSLGHYQAMVGNGYRTSNLPNSVTDNRFTFAGTNYYDPLGPFGKWLTDYEYSCDPLVRIGHSFSYSPQTEDTLGNPLAETDFLRLVDGTRINQIGALAPGATVSNFDLYFYGVDFAWKYRGWSFNSELFLRWIEQIEGNGIIPVNELFQRGYYVEGGRFLIPKKLDFNVRYGQVSGAFGNASEISAGCNWYPLESNGLKLSFDVTSLDGSPLQNTATDILVGDEGTLFRTQMQAEF